MKREGNKVYYEEGDIIYLRDSYRLALVKCKEYIKVGKDTEWKANMAKDVEVVAIL